MKFLGANGYDLCKKEFDSALRQIAMLGYGLVFISHEQLKNVKTEKGEEYQKFMPTLADRPRLIVNRLVDIIAYLRLSSEDNKRYIYTRGSDRYEAGSRFPLLAPKIEMSYDNLVAELYKAIDAQVAANNTETTNQQISDYFAEEVKFEDLLAEAKEIFNKLMENNKEENAKKANDIIVKYFGKPVKISTTTEAQRELVELVVEDWKQLLH